MRPASLFQREWERIKSVVSGVNLNLSFRFYFLCSFSDTFLSWVPNILLTWPYVITCFCVSVCFSGWSAFTDSAFFCPCLTLSLWLGGCSLSIQLYENTKPLKLTGSIDVPLLHLYVKRVMQQCLSPLFFPAPSPPQRFKSFNYILIMLSVPSHLSSFRCLASWPSIWHKSEQLHHIDALHSVTLSPDVYPLCLRYVSFFSCQYTCRIIYIQKR